MMQKPPMRALIRAHKWFETIRSVLFYLKQPLAVFDRLAVFNQHLEDDPLGLSLDLVHDFHGLDDANHRIFDDFGVDVRKRFALRAGGSIKSTNHGRFDESDSGLFLPALGGSGIRRRAWRRTRAGRR